MAKPKKSKPPAALGKAAGLPSGASRMLREAVAAYETRRFEEADRALTGVLALAPACAEALRLLGRMQLMRGERAAAVESLGLALASEPDNALVRADLGIALFEAGSAREAIACFKRACKLAPRMVPAWFNLARALKLEGEIDAAIDALERVLALDINHVGAWLLKAEAQASKGDAEAASASYRQILRRQPAHAQAWLGLANLKVRPLEKADVLRIRQAMGLPGNDHRTRAALGFALAQALEDQGDYDAAFEALCQANAAQRRTEPWDGAGFSAKIDAILQAFRAPLRGASDPALGRGVIFVVSLPRSGSSLVEQILASHPAVEGSGEITDLQEVLDDESLRRKAPFERWVGQADSDDWERLGKEYLERVAKRRGQRLMLVDKNLLNWQWVGAIVAMLPGATIVHCQRDPVETCLGCFRQWFRTGNGFSYELGDMARYWRDHDRLCRHWHTLFPERIHQHVHEALLADPEAQIRQLLAACGLDFDPACLQFHRNSRSVFTASATQVRQPLRDTSRAEQYGDALQTLRHLLAQP